MVPLARREITLRHGAALSNSSTPKRQSGALPHAPPLCFFDMGLWKYHDADTDSPHRLQYTHAATRNIVPTKTLPALPARQHSLPTPGAIADSPCSLLINDRIPSKENPSHSTTRLIPVEARFSLRNICSYPRLERQRSLGRFLR